MRKILLVVTACIFIIPGLNAQDLSKGDVVVSVGLNLDTSFDRNADFSASASAEYFFADKWSVGLGLRYGRSKSFLVTHETLMGLPLKLETETIINTFALGPRVTNYVKLSQNIYFTNQLAFAIGWAKNKVTTSNPHPDIENESWVKTSSVAYSVGYAPGLMCFLNKNIWLGCSVGALMYTFTDSGVDNKRSDFTMNWNDISMSVGFRF